MPYYPKHSISMISEGDLCYYTSHAVQKNELWITDEIGYRNNRFYNDPDVILIGDSFLLGISITQDSILSNLLMSKSNTELKIYNLSQATFADFVTLLSHGTFNVPKIIVYSIGEREIPQSLTRDYQEKVYRYRSYDVWIDKAVRLYSINYFMARVFNDKFNGVQSEIDERMFFFKGKEQLSNIDKIDTIVDIVSGYKKFCDSLGIRFLFLPVPNKETVYYDLVPFEAQPAYLFELDRRLRQKGISTVNTLQIYNDFRKSSDQLIYHYDDTHWNSQGINIIADELVRLFETGGPN